MSSNNNSPAIRFSGFAGPWERRKLGELSDITTGKLDANAMTPDGEYDFYTCSLQVYKINKYAFEGPAITIAGNGYVGCLHLADGKFNAYQRTYVLSNFKAVREYLYAEIGNKLPSKVNQEARNGNIPYIVMDMLTDLVVALPNAEEQCKLGNLFATLDRLITLHQRKYEKLVNLKKAMLDKMFPKNGELVPEVRFTGFSGNWERRKLGEMAQFNPKEVVPNEFEYVDLESVVGTEMLSHRRETKRSAPSRAQRVAHVGDLFYQTVRPYQKNNYLFEIADGDYVFSTGYAQMRPSVDGYFLLSVILHDKFVNAVLNMCIGTGYPAVNSKDLAKIEVCAPTQIAEQQIIGRYFRMLDKLTNSQQRKLAKLQKLKSAFLEKMFV